MESSAAMYRCEELPLIVRPWSSDDNAHQAPLRSVMRAVQRPRSAAGRVARPLLAPVRGNVWRSRESKGRAARTDSCIALFDGELPPAASVADEPNIGVHLSRRPAKHFDNP